MIKRIQQLPAMIANQIAAGEVIERPASVVKELLENSLDAGATHIEIDLAYGGLNHIKISDNGSGILAEDLPLAIAAHATSKINRLDDLYAINSMGFRGEALASIASIAKLKINSKPEQQEHAVMLIVLENKQELVPCARTKGTTIEVHDLFFNAPVRKRFLKSEKLEFQAIEMVVKRFALSVPHIALSLSHNNKLIFSLVPALDEQARQKRVAKILGRAFIESAIFLEVTQGSMHLQGWISNKIYQRSQNDRQWVYINQRMVKDKLINHAIKQAYDTLLYPGRFPSCVLYLTMNTREIDVNVHPTKHEVRFEQPRLVHDFFIAQLTRALEMEQEKGSNYTQIHEPSPQWFDSPVKPLKSAASLHHGFASVAPKLSGYEELPWINLNKQFSLIWFEQVPYLVDTASLYQAWLTQELNIANYPLASRPLLVVIRYPLIKQVHEIEQVQSFLSAVGIDTEVENDALLIRSIPIAVPYLDLKIFCERIFSLLNYSFDKVQKELIKAQSLETAQLSLEERLNLSQFFVSVQHNKDSDFDIYKQFTLEDCRMLLNV